MPNADRRHGLFPALLKHWRRARGLSQLDLALAADVSARHISFLETGRSRPSVEMVVLLATALGVPLRQTDAMLQAAGHPPRHGADDEQLPAAVLEALDLLKAHHEPYPLVVVDRCYRICDLNQAALRLFEVLVGPVPAGAPDGLSEDPNLAVLTFDPHGAQPHILNFDEVGRQLLWRIQREVLADAADSELAGLLDTLLAMPTIDASWRSADLGVPSDPALVLHLRAGAVELRFLTVLTAFQAPQNALVDDLRIETWLPYDETTATYCRSTADAAAPGATPPE